MLFEHWNWFGGQRNVTKWRQIWMFSTNANSFQLWRHLFKILDIKRSGLWVHCLLGMELFEVSRLIGSRLTIKTRRILKRFQFWGNISSGKWIESRKVNDNERNCSYSSRPMRQPDRSEGKEQEEVLMKCWKLEAEVLNGN